MANKCIFIERECLVAYTVCKFSWYEMSKNCLTYWL